MRYPIEITCTGDYINLYHVYSRIRAANPNLLNRKLIRRKVEASLWRLYVTSDEHELLDLPP